MKAREKQSGDRLGKACRNIGNLEGVEGKGGLYHRPGRVLRAVLVSCAAIAATRQTA